MADVPTTRERLLEAGMALFAERGFRATRVGDIEAAAGLQPRRGALYNHFASKEALLEEGVREYIASIATGVTQIQALEVSEVSVGDTAVLRLIIEQLGRWFLGALDGERQMVHLLEHDGARLADITKLLRTDVVDQGHHAAAALLRAAVPKLEDPDGTAVVLLASLVGLRRTTWTFGEAPLGVSDDRVLARWVELVLAIVAANTSPRPKRRVARGRT